MIGAAICATCENIRRLSLGMFAGPAADMLALPGCACQHLEPGERHRRLFLSGAGPLAELSVRYFAEVALWVAVAKGADVRALGAAADVALGLGAGAGRDDAVARAVGEMLERYGAALVPAGSGDSVPLVDRGGRPCGEAPAAAAWMPYHRGGKAVLPASSTGLAFAFRRDEAMVAAALEVIERRAIDRLGRTGPGGATAIGQVRIGEVTAHAFRLAAAIPVVLVLVPGPDGRIVAAGAAARSDEHSAREAAAREAGLDWLVFRGELLPGCGLKSASLIGPLAEIPICDWPCTPGPVLGGERGTAGAMDGFGFADLTPLDIKAAGGHVVRAIEVPVHA